MAIRTNLTSFPKSSKPSKITIHLVAILFAMFNILDIKIAGFSKIFPLFDAMIIFYFAIFNQVFSLWFIFLLGIFNDSLNGNPLGLTPLIYILLIELFKVINQRFIVREEFMQIFYQFILFLFCLLFLKWAVLSLYNQAFYNITILIIQLILSSCFYVVIHKFCDYLSQKFS